MLRRKYGPRKGATERTASQGRILVELTDHRRIENARRNAMGIPENFWRNAESKNWLRKRMHEIPRELVHNENMIKSGRVHHTDVPETRQDISNLNYELRIIEFLLEMRETF